MLIAVHLAMLCVMVILRRQWVEKERLIYPIMQMNLEMTQVPDRGRLLPSILRNRILWLGFAVPMIICTLQALAAYSPVFPRFRPHLPIPILGAFVSFSTIGFFFLVQREIAFGLWVFSLLNTLQTQLYNLTGWGTEPEAAVSYWSYGIPSIVHQSMGAMLVLVLGGLWVAREHLIRVFRKAFAGAPEVGDDNEIISYRGAVIGLLISVGVMLLWLIQVGCRCSGPSSFYSSPLLSI